MSLERSRRRNGADRSTPGPGSQHIRLAAQPPSTAAAHRVGAKMSPARSRRLQQACTEMSAPHTTPERSGPGGPAMARPTPEQLVELWNLKTMPTENVRFSQSYVDDEVGPDGKPLCSAIVALLVDDPSVFSDMHRLPTDEIWHFYLGDPIELLLLHPDGRDELVILGHDVLAGQRVQTVVVAGVYMGARLRPGGEFAVYGNTMAPGFVLTDFEAAGAEELIAGWPQRAELIRALTRD